jgi:hypothetical protein
MGVDVRDDDLVDAGRLTAGTDLPTIREIRDALAPITKRVEDRAGQEIDRELAADYRVAAIAKAGLLNPALTVPAVLAADDEKTARFLDSEIVAVYW